MNTKPTLLNKGNAKQIFKDGERRKFIEGTITGFDLAQNVAHASASSTKHPTVISSGSTHEVKPEMSLYAAKGRRISNGSANRVDSNVAEEMVKKAEAEIAIQKTLANARAKSY